MFRVQQQYQSGDTRVEGCGTILLIKILVADQFPFICTIEWCTLSHSNDGMVLWILHGSGGLLLYPHWGNIMVGAKCRTSYGGNQAGEELTSTEQGPTSGSHHAALPCAAVSCAGPSVWNMFSNPWSSWLLSVVQVSDLNVSSLDMLLWTQEPKQDSVSLITLLCFLHSTALGSGSKILPYLHYHLSLDSPRCHARSGPQLQHA